MKDFKSLSRYGGKSVQNRLKIIQDRTGKSQGSKVDAGSRRGPESGRNEERITKPTHQYRPIN